MRERYRERERDASDRVAGGVRTPTNFPWVRPALAMSLEWTLPRVRSLDSVCSDGFTVATAACGQTGRVTPLVLTIDALDPRYLRKAIS